MKYELGMLPVRNFHALGDPTLYHHQRWIDDFLAAATFFHPCCWIQPFTAGYSRAGLRESDGMELLPLQFIASTLLSWITLRLVPKDCMMSLICEAWCLYHCQIGETVISTKRLWSSQMFSRPLTNLGRFSCVFSYSLSVTDPPYDEGTFLGLPWLRNWTMNLVCSSYL